MVLAYADDDNILEGSLRTVKENGALFVATKETGLEVNADKTKYMVMSRDQNAGRSHSMKIDNTGQQNLPFLLAHEGKYLFAIELLTLNLNMQVVFPPSPTVFL
jgi:hypothetical protein